MAVFEPHTTALVKPPEKTIIQGGFPSDTGYQDTLTIGLLAPLFLEWARYEMRRALPANPLDIPDVIRSRSLSRRT